MNRKVIKPVVLSGLFLAALIVFSIITNQDNKDMTTAMKEATLPIVQFYEENNSVAQLHGYVSEMNITKMRDGIVPVDHTRLLPLKINTYGQKIRGIAYEIRSLDDSRLVAKGDAQGIKEKNNEISANLKIQNILGKGEEYELIVILASGKNKIRYYTRLMQTQNDDTQACMDFALQFHEYTFRDDANKFIPKYMDAATGDTSTLNYVDLSCTLNQITWADLKPEQMGELEASFKEINDSYDVITLRYVVTTKGTGGETEYYNVEEYYRVRVGTEKIYLLSFERTMEEIFRGEGDQISKDMIDLGIRSENVSYKTNETGNVICFVQQGELWSYNQIENNLTRVFSFRSQEGMDIRENYQEHDIRILRVDEGGSLDFVVYGYMNCGEHEGQVGVSVCHYDGVTNTVEEMLFVPTTLSYEIVKEQIGKLMYVSDSGVFYLTVSNQVYRIQMDSRKAEVYIDGLKSDMLVNSEDGRYIAWSEDGTTMHVTDLEKGESFDIHANENQLLKPLGFLGSDCIYGWGYRTDIFSTQTQTDTLALSQVLIVDTSDSAHSVLKTYETPGIYVTGIRIQDGSIYLSRVMKNGDIYVDTTEDTIMNRDLQEKDQVNIDTVVSDVKQKEVVLKLLEETSGSTPKTLIPKLIENEEPNTLEIKNLNASSAYYVYAKGGLDSTWTDPAQAILHADSLTGVVLNRAQQYVWERGNMKTQLTLNTEDVPEIIRSGSWDKDVLQQGLGDSGTVIDLTGCSLENVLYEISAQRAVIAKTGADSSVVIVGYDQYNTWLLDPATGEVSPYGMNDSTALFQAAGNVFISYLDNQK